MNWNLAYIGVGSNLGDKVKTCIRAIQEIHSHPQCRLLKISSFYETEPLVKKAETSKPWYVNAVIKIKTELNAVKLLQFLLTLEKQLGRVPSREPWESRTIDLDLLFFNHEIVENALIKLPHPEVQNRRFVLEPLCEIEPELQHPILHKSIQELFKSLLDSKKVIPLFHISLSQIYSANSSTEAPRKDEAL